MKNETELLENLRLIPPFLQELTSVSIAQLDYSGNVIQANEGFTFLIGSDALSIEKTNAKNKFINPKFDNFKTITSTKTTLLYQGLMTVGSVQEQTRSVQGKVYQIHQSLWFIAEYDYHDLEKLTSTVIELNNELTQIQRELIETNFTLKLKEKEITELMLSDSLTGLPNRRHFESEFERECERSYRVNSTFCMAICDIDHFKRINDNYGHNIGDEILKLISNSIKNSIRTTDFLARWGGEEFVILFTNCKSEFAYQLAERVRKKIETISIEYLRQQVTISIGLTELKQDQSLQEIFNQADKALFQAKNNDRNCVKIL